MANRSARWPEIRSRGDQRQEAIVLWRGGRRSENIEDRRGSGAGGPFGSGMPRGVRTGGIGGIGLIIIVLLGLLFGINPLSLLQMGGGPEPQVYYPQDSAPPARQSPQEAELSEFISVVLADTEDTWGAIFAASGQTYREPTLVLFRGAVQSACGFAQSATGPFYCPRDGKVYLDLSFFDDLHRRFGAPGDFAQAYVLAHEIGHHVQNLLGIAPKVEALQRQASQAEANRLSVMMELQADCFAGVWASSAKGRQILEAGDIEEGIRAAAAVGDDHIQRRSQGYVVPDAFTHGTSAQRAAWFRKGLAAGNPSVCNTFDAGAL